MITHVAHGGIFNHEGPIAEVTLDHLTHTQADHIRQLEAYARERGVSLPASDPAQASDIIARGAHIDQLIKQLEPPNQAWLHLVNVTVRSHYLRHLLKDNPRALESLDLSPTDLELRTQTLTTTLSGPDYVAQCRNEGVPVFTQIQLQKSAGVHTGNAPPMPGQWTNWGFVQNEFIDTSDEAQLWSWQSDTTTKGICLALPRWRGNVINAFGVICTGYETGKVCYFDNNQIPDNTNLTVGAFRSGAGLYPPIPAIPANNPGGVCSDCHAGRNPFVVHPDDMAFKRLIDNGTRLTPVRWPDHIVHSTWPNVGPLATLPVPGPNEKACTACHDAGAQDQFPRVSNLLERYCLIVLPAAASPAFLNKTMPPYNITGIYTTQYDYLVNLCTTPPNPGNTTTTIPADEPRFLSPPVVFSPIYACSRVIGVTGARLNAEITLFVNGSAVATQVVTDPSMTSFTLGAALNSGDQVSALQRFNGELSAVSTPVIVTAYQGDVPPPKISPQITHQCAQSVAVEHIAGMDLRLYVNNNLAGFRRGDAKGYSVMTSNVAFNQGDKIEVTQTVCRTTSKLSTPARVLPTPSPLRRLTIAPTTLYTGQELFDISSIVEGAFINVSEQVVGPLGAAFSWPTDRRRDLNIRQELGRAILAGDRFTFTQNLCATTSPPLTTTLSAVQSCDNMPAPQIEQPLNGNTFIIVRSAIPGATLRVQVGSDELGDGAGNPIALSRALVSGEVLIVTQQLGACNASQAFAITVL